MRYRVNECLDYRPCLDLGNDQRLFGDGLGTNVTYRKFSTIPFLALYNGAMDIGYHRLSARKVLSKL